MARIGPDRVDPRRLRSRQRVIGAAVELLREGGSSGLTVEAVTARSGVAKSTIYRQFPSRDEIHIAALECCAGPPAMESDGAVLGDVEAWMQRLAVALRETDFADLMPTAIDAAERRPEMARLLAALGVQRRSVLVARLRAAVQRGELCTTTEPDLVVSALVGPLFYRRFISRQPTSRAFVSRLARAVLNPLLASPCASSSHVARPR